MRERYKVSAKGSHQNSDSSNNLSSLEFFFICRRCCCTRSVVKHIFKATKRQSDKATKRQRAGAWKGNIVYAWIDEHLLSTIVGTNE